MTRHRISLPQLFFLTLTSILSGIFLFDVRGATGVSAVFLLCTLFFAVAAVACRRASTGIADAASLVFRHRAGGALISALFLFCAAADVSRTWLFTFAEVRRVTAFLPAWALFAATFALSLFAATRGLTVLGRLAELTPFLLVPLVVVCFFGDARPLLLTEVYPAGRTALCAGFAVPFGSLFLLAVQTTVPGDECASDALDATFGRSSDRGRTVFLIGSGGAALACALALLLQTCLTRTNLLFTLTLWMLAFLRLALPFSVLISSLREQKSAWTRGATVGAFALAGSLLFALANGVI